MEMTIEQKVDKLLAGNERIEALLEGIVEQLDQQEESISNLSLPGVNYSIEEP